MKKFCRLCLFMIIAVFCFAFAAACDKSSGESFEADGLNAVQEHLEANLNYTVTLRSSEGNQVYYVADDCVLNVFGDEPFYSVCVYLVALGNTVNCVRVDYSPKRGSMIQHGESFKLEGPISNSRLEFCSKFGFSEPLYLDWTYESGKYVYSDSTLTIKGNKITVSIGVKTSESENIRKCDYIYGEFGTTECSLPSALQQKVALLKSRA